MKWSTTKRANSATREKCATVQEERRYDIWRKKKSIM